MISLTCLMPTADAELPVRPGKLSKEEIEPKEEFERRQRGVFKAE